MTKLIESNNPANINSLAAKEANLSYWGYMAQKHPGMVQNFIWGAKKVIRKQQRENDKVIMSTVMAHPKFMWIRGLLGQRKAY